MKTYTEQELQAAIKTTMQETIKAMMEWFEKETHVVDKTTGEKLTNVEIEVNDDAKKPIGGYIAPRLEKVGITYIPADAEQ